MESDSDGDSGYNSEKEFIRRQLNSYMEALAEFRSSRSHWHDRIPEISALPLEMKHRLIGDTYEKILYGLHDRPRFLEFGTICGDELELFCEALVVAWRLLPDSWVGLNMILDYLAENTLSSDLAKIEEETLDIIKEIARNKKWPGNPFCGPMMTGGQAKTLLARITRNAGFADSTTVPIVRMVNSVPGTGQPSRRPRPFNPDRRRTCSNPDCYEVENEEKFKQCAVCKKVVYCSKECQRIHWKDGHKKQCGKKAKSSNCSK